ncbi:cytochrome P450 [Actinokineospora sp. NBRC 105648]|uniref:cytochrome P450 n=1 Tax=Actinokineospora sp. NBRC 105648 TaxID=3032206 RepID=UPI0024A2A752|nr:cytochrome P450 [Actinokineospora sp. NBRC 105648]GLZ36521.1 cytochrome P450 [Actinokineospora sp. NBRC 105648]
MISAGATVADPLLRLFAPSHRADPYTPAAELRAAGAVHRTPLGLRLLTRYADAAAVLQNTAWSHADEAAHLHPSVAAASAAEELPTSFLWMDPPDHTRLRTLVSKAFVPRMVTRLRPRIERLAESLVDGALAAGEFDLIQQIAYPLPLTIVCELMGIPVEAHADVQRWSQDLARGFDPDPLMTPEAHAARSAAASEFMAYLRSLIDQRKADPRDDLLSALSLVEDQGDVLTELEMLSTCLTTVVAGHETTVNLVGSGLLALMRNPDQLAVLRARPEVIPAAVDELLRYEPPVQLTTRSATRAMTVAGEEFAPGDGVVVLINSGNRDPAAFTDPDRLDVTRYHDRATPPPRHLAFSLGIHYCLGAPLAQLEMSVLLEVLLRKVSVLEPRTDTPPYKPNLIVRGLAALPTRFA